MWMTILICVLIGLALCVLAAPLMLCVLIAGIGDELKKMRKIMEGE